MNFLFIFADYLIIFSSILSSIYLNNIFIYAMSMILIGSRMRALENLLHDASHFQLFKNKKLNDFAGMFLCAFPIVNSLFAYRKAHLNHHRYFGDKNLDPDLIRYKKMGMDDSPLKKRNIQLFFLKIFLLINTFKYIIGTLKSFVYCNDAPFHELLNRFLYYMVFLSFLFYFDLWGLFLLYWVVPFFTTFQVIRQMSEISEHGGIYKEEEPIKMTRNNFCHPVLQFLIYPHNDFCHLVHHLAPFVAHYNLLKAHHVFCDEPIYTKAHNCYGYFKKGKIIQGKTTIDSMTARYKEKMNSMYEHEVIDVMVSEK